jgi:carboxymethylenebutenolidase
MQDKIRECVDAYRKEQVSRRGLLQSLVAATGSYALAHLFLESSGLAASVISQREASAANVDAETVRYPSSSGGYQIEGYLAKPKGAGPHPAVIVIHENRGLNEHIREVTRRFATEGFVALGPDLLSQVGGTGKMKTPDEATAVLGDLPLDGVLDDLKVSFNYLGKDQGVNAQKISAVGFCWGGWRSFMMATQIPELYRTVVFYGSTPDGGLEKVKAPVLAHYAERDHAITGDALWTQKQMKKLGKRFQFFVYADTDHAFFNDTGPRYNASAAKLAWARTLAFLRDQLLPASAG